VRERGRSSIIWRLIVNMKLYAYKHLKQLSN